MSSEHYFYLGPPSRYSKPQEEDLKPRIDRFPYLDFERQDKFGYFPSTKKYSVLAEDILNPVSENYFWRTNPVFATTSMREKNKPWDTRHALAMVETNDIMKEREDAEERAKLEARKSLRQRARSGFGETRTRITSPHLFSYPTLDENRGSRPSLSGNSDLSSSWYLVRAKTPEVPQSAVARSHLPVDIVNVGASSRGGTSGLRPGGYGSGMSIPPGSRYFTDENYPDSFFKQATSVNDMITKS